MVGDFSPELAIENAVLAGCDFSISLNISPRGRRIRWNRYGPKQRFYALRLLGGMTFQILSHLGGVHLSRVFKFYVALYVIQIAGDIAIGKSFLLLLVDREPPPTVVGRLVRKRLATRTA